MYMGSKRFAVGGCLVGMATIAAACGGGVARPQTTPSPQVELPATLSVRLASGSVVSLALEE